MEVIELEQILFKELGYDGRPELLHDGDIPWSNGRSIPGINAAILLKNTPIAYFSRFPELNIDAITELHKKVWSQSKVPLLFVTLPHEIRIYNTYEPTPLSGGKLDSSSRLLQHLTNLTESLAAQQKIRSQLVQANHYERVYLETGAFWNTEESKRINYQNRADRQLIDGMAQMRKMLRNAGLSNLVAYTLLGRSIFIRYLEDRNILHHVLQNALKSRTETYALFQSLAERFNGDLFPIEDDEKNVSQEHLDLLRGFLQGNNLETGQLSLWAFNFGYIPIELVSHIYDTFIDDQRASGAYYTPLLLADFVLEETMGDDVIQSDMTCLDPACGSGIFLVGAYRRLIQAWRHEHGLNPTPEILNNILQKGIFGVDKNTEAVRIAAFSLYLEILNHLSNDHIQNDTFQFPSLKNKNLIASDFFSEEIDRQFADTKFDRIIGNMPWGRGTLTLDSEKWLAEGSLAVGGKQAAPAFMLRAPKFCKDDGELAFIAPAKSTILVNSETHKNFRYAFFKNYSVRAVVNFSATVYELFEGAISPAVALFYSPTLPNFDQKLIYGTPKPSPLSQHIKAILLDTTEIKFLDRSQLLSNPNLWKVALWGTPRDEALIERLAHIPTLKEQSLQLGWEMREGFMAEYEGSDKNKAEWLIGMPFVPTKNFTPYLVKTSDTVQGKMFHRPRSEEVFKAPLVLIHHSNCQAAFSNVNVAFSNSISGITGKKGQEQILKWLVCVVNSPLIKYYQFLTSTRWGVERANPLQGEYEEIPFLIPNNDNHDFVQAIYHFDQIVKLVEQMTPFFNMEDSSEFDKHKNAINSLVLKIYGISSDEQQLIEDMLVYGIGFFNWAKRKSRKPNGAEPVRRPDEDQLVSYAKTFIKTVSSILKVKRLALNATVYKNGAPLTVVSFHITEQGNTKPVGFFNQADAMRTKLRELDNLLIEQRTPSMYMRRHVRIYDGNQVSLVRPSERRFWTQSQARVDADAFINELFS